MEPIESQWTVGLLWQKETASRISVILKRQEASAVAIFTAGDASQKIKVKVCPR